MDFKSEYEPKTTYEDPPTRPGPCFRNHSLTSAQTLSLASFSASVFLVSSDGLQVLRRQEFQLQSTESSPGPPSYHAVQILHNGSCGGPAV